MDRLDPTYYPARQLDDYPALLAPVAIQYPQRALAEYRKGRVLLMLLIAATGKVDEVKVVEAQPEGYFEEAALHALRTAAFSAGRRNGLPVRTRVLMQLDFDPASASTSAQ